MDVEKLVATFKKKFPLINEDELRTLITDGDPTARRTNAGMFCGRYATWIGNLFVGGKLKAGDIPELKGTLEIYNANKTRYPTGRTNLSRGGRHRVLGRHSMS